MRFLAVDLVSAMARLSSYEKIGQHFFPARIWLTDTSWGVLERIASFTIGYPHRMRKQSNDTPRIRIEPKHHLSISGADFPRLRLIVLHTSLD